MGQCRGNFLFFILFRCRFFRFLHLLYPLSQTFVPFLIFFLVGGFGKSVLVGEVHVCEVPQELGCVIVSVAALAEGVDDEIAFDDRPLCVRQFGYNLHPLFLVQRHRLVFDAAKRIMLPLQFGQHDEIKHSVLVLRKRTFGIVILTDYLFRIGNNLLGGELFETLVPLLQCLNGTGAISFLFIST